MKTAWIPVVQKSLQNIPTFWQENKYQPLGGLHKLGYHLCAPPPSCNIAIILKILFWPTLHASKSNL